MSDTTQRRASPPLDVRRRELRDALDALDRARAEAIVQDCLRDAPPVGVVEGLVVPVLVSLGEDWSAGRAALSQVYLSGRICEELVDRILPPLSSERRGGPRQAIVVLDDYHLLGKRIVLSVMRASGFDVLDLGRMEVSPLVERVVDEGVEILLVSALMLPSALRVRTLRAALDALHRRVRIAVGGAPFLLDPELWREVGADAMGRNAADAVTIVGGWTEAGG